MTGLTEFHQLLGGFTLSQATQVIMVVVFLCILYAKVKNFFKEKYETLKRREDAEKLRDTQIKEALESVRKYPEYRKQSIEIQSKLEDEIQAIRTRLDETVKRLTDMEENQNRRERNKLRDLLLQNYRYYTNPESNPTQSWTRMEAEAFWELFRDYEDAGGNGYVHTVVQPAMNLLTVHDCASTE